MVLTKRVLVFDAYGTLFDPHSVIPSCENAFPQNGTELSRLWRTKQLEYTWLRSLMGQYEDFWQVTESALVFACKTLHLPCDASTRSRLMEAYLSLEPYPDAREAMSALANYPMAILSNGSPSMLQAVVQQTKFESYFSHIISVDEVRIFKPSPRVYRLVEETLAVDRKAVAFVSSNAWDAIGAKAFGFWTCWVNRSESCPDELGYAPDSSVRRLTELAGALPAV